MAFPDITTLPTPPSRNDDSATFTSRANAFLGALPTLQSEINDFSTYADVTFTNDITDVKDAAEAASLAAETYKDTTLSLKDDVQSLYTSINNIVNFKGNWSDLTGSLAVPASVFHNGEYWNLVNALADVTTSEPSEANSDWILGSYRAALKILKLKVFAGL